MMNKESLEEDLRLINHLIRQFELEQKVFAYIPIKQHPSKVVEKQNYFKNKTDHLLLSINNDKAKKPLLDYLTRIGDKTDKELMSFVLDSLSHGRFLLQSEDSLISLVNIKRLVKDKMEILEDDFLTFDYGKDYENANYFYYVVFLLETDSQIEYHLRNNLDFQNSYAPLTFIEIAVRTIQKFLDRIGDQYVSFVFEYFFIRFTNMYKGALLNNFNQERSELMGDLRTEFGDYLLRKQLHSLQHPS